MGIGYICPRFNNRLIQIMKKYIGYLLAVSLFLSLSSFSVTSPKKSKKEEEIAAKTEKVIQRYGNILKAVDYDMEKFLTITPKEYRKLTGEKLSLKEGFELKLVQKQLKNQMNATSMGTPAPFPQWAYIVMVILGLGFIPIGIRSGWNGNDWWINILLTLCFWIPGVIHGLIIMNKYY